MHTEKTDECKRSTTVCHVFATVIIGGHMIKLVKVINQKNSYTYTVLVPREMQQVDM